MRTCLHRLVAGLAFAGALQVGSTGIAWGQDQPVTRAELEEVSRQMREMRERHEREMAGMRERLEATQARAESAEARASQSLAEVQRTMGDVSADAAQQDEAPWPDTFEFHGYLRAGFGVNGDGGDQVTFQAPGAFAKYRLGNEAETYLETTFRYNFPKLENDDAQFATQIRFAVITDNDATFDPDDQFVLREAFGEAKNVIKAMPDVSFWAGQRFYRRYDIHINDFYFLDMSGYGGGVEEVPAGIGKIAFAYIGFSDDATVTDVGQLAKNNFDLRLYDVDLLGKATFWLNYAFIDGATNTTTGATYDDSEGAAFGFIHEAKTPWEGTNLFSIQYGYDIASSLAAGGFVPPTDDAEDAWTFRITDQWTFQPNENFAMQAAFVYQDRDTGAANGEETWVSAGARPIWFFTRHLALAFEAGWDYVDNEAGGFDGSLYKFTIAPEITWENKFFSRPNLRFFYTYAFWDDELVGRIGNPVYGNDDSGQTIGVQVESWW